MFALYASLTKKCTQISVVTNTFNNPSGFWTVGGREELLERPRQRDKTNYYTIG